MEEFKNIPDPIPHSKIGPELFHEDIDKIKLFEVIERNEDCNNNHISILTLDPVKYPENDSYLAALTQLILTYEKEMSSDQTCDFCGMTTRNLQNHLDINKCKMMPFPNSNKNKRNIIWRSKRKQGKQ